MRKQYQEREKEVERLEGEVMSFEKEAEDGEEHCSLG